MGVQTILGQKIDQSQKFLEDGTRIPVTRLWVKGNVVVAVKTKDKHNYSAIQLGFGKRKKANKALLGHIKRASLPKAPKFLKEIRLNNEDSLPNLGEIINATEVFKPGDVIDVTGISKGKGFAGVVKRHHFKGGPRTHGQSDRERAPGSIGQTTTPGRVYKGKRMAGRMGHERVTIKNLEIVDVSEDTILVKGLVPGGKDSLIMVKKVSENKKFVPLYKEEAKIAGDLSDSAGSLPTSDDARQEEAKQTSDNIAGRQSTSDDAQQDFKKNNSEEPASLSESRQLEADEKPTGNKEPTFSSSESELTPSSIEDSIKEKNKEDKKRRK
ncbi:MAG: 50S ribosomal protein L3 [Candidatus Levybacteria bacterium RIFCSPLOWO2_01_FULL_38_21]|nr:MAG: 50S ribosomal protein L3 [Candidatus Levybacteria bacterium RIFCSPLOWO2_01_FULL_38_21]